MKLVAGHLNNVLLESLHTKHTPRAKAIVVAVAYADNYFLHFLNKAAECKVPLTFYGRYDETMPVELPVIEWFLDNPHLKGVECRLVADYYHPKIIWWKGEGVYIGSANLGKRAWFDNVEVGTFFSEEDIHSHGMQAELETIIGRIHIAAVPINDKLRKSMKAMAEALKTRENAEEVYKSKFEKERWIARGKPVTSVASPAGNTKMQVYERRRHEITALMESLGAVLRQPQNRPDWMPGDTPMFLQVDQFLYAYDEQFPQNKGRSIDEVISANALRHQEAVKEAVVWWRNGDYKTKEIREQVETVYPLVRKRFGKDSILKLTQGEFADSFTRIHAVQERARNRSNESLGLARGRPAGERLQRHAEQVYGHVSAGGKSVLQMLEYVLWGDNLEHQDRRIYNGSNDERWAMPDIRVSTLSDILGWVRPDDFPPINGRTVKALAKLGYLVEAGAGKEYAGA